METRYTHRLDPELMDAVLDATAVARLGLSISFNDGQRIERVYVNETCAQILGYEASELVGQSLLLTLPPEEQAKMQALSERWHRGEAVPQFVETVALRKDGSRVPIEVSYSIVRRPDRTFTVAFLRDVSERKRSEQALLESEARIRQIIEAAPDAIVVLHQGRLLFANPSFLRILGYERTTDVIGMALADIVHSGDRATIGERLDQLVKTGKSLTPYEYRATRPDGQSVVVEVLSFPFQFDGKACILSFARDMTERKQLQARLFQADRMATMGTVAAGVAHEVNNPLSYALLNIDLLDRQICAAVADPAAREPILATLSAIREGSQRVASIVRDLRSFSRDSPDDGALVDVEEIVESSINIAMSEIRGRTRLVRRYQPVPPVRASPARLGQVFLNLLLNASHALSQSAPEHNELKVTIERRGEDGAPDEGVLIEVSDNGPGIAPEILDRVFEPFFTTKPSGVGTGLGLAICQNIVTSLRGELTVRNLPGRGAAFRVLFPVGPPPAPTSLAERRSGRNGAASHHAVAPFLSERRHRILVIDDEMALAYAIRRALASEYEVELAGGSTEAFRRIAQVPAFDAILCDVVMPAVDGIDFFVQLQRTRPDLVSRLIFMTGAASMPRVEEFLASVANPSIDKPLDLDRLRKLLAETCANSFSGDPCVNY